MNASPMRSQPAAVVAPNALPALTAVATPTAADRPPEHDRAAARRFAELLRQSRSDRAAPAARAPAAAETPAAQAAASSPDNAGPAQESVADAMPDPVPAPSAAPTAAAKARAPNTKGATSKAAVDHASAPDDAAATDAATRVESSAAPAPTSTEARAEDLALVAAAAAAERAAKSSPPPGDVAAADTPSSAVDDSETSSSTEAGDGRRGAIRARGAVVETADVGARPGAGSAAQPVATTPEPMFRAALGDSLRATGATATRAHVTEAAGAAIVAGVASRSAGASQGVAAAPTLAQATPIDAPGFAAALGVHVRMLAQDGVQHAELHLNPVETGPVSIHIEVDGNSARVEFGADLAATRQAIERGLPELASALRDAGLTLTGGGVSQHAGSRGGGDESASTERSRAHAGAALPEAATVRIERRTADGGIDLYA